MVASECNIQPAVPLRKPHSPAAHGPRRDPLAATNQKFSPQGHIPEVNHRNNRNSNGFCRHDKKFVNNHKNSNTPKSADNQNRAAKPSTSRDQSNSIIKPIIIESTLNPELTQSEVNKSTETLSQLQLNKEQYKPVKVTTEHKVIPKNYLLETLSVGDTAMLSVDARAEDCGTKQPGFVCLSISKSSEQQYEQLCGPFGELCGAATRVHSVVPGETFAYLDPTDEGWYRARCLSPASAALLDCCKVVQLGTGDRYCGLPAQYADTPEFCCLLRDAGVALGNSLVATLSSKTATGFKVSLVNSETGASAGEGEVTRWLPEVEHPITTPIAPAIPEVDRPCVTNNSRVLLVEAGAVDRVLVRPADTDSIRKFDSLLEDVVMFGMKAQPLTEPPTKGQTLIGVYSDGLMYRALCKRTNVKQNKYLLEYIEFGNLEIVPLESLYPCPPELTLSNQPTQVALVKLQTAVNAFTEPAAQYLRKISDDTEELVLTMSSGAGTAPSGAEVCLTKAKNNESINKKVTEMCTPEWKKLEERGGDVLESEVIMNHHLQYLDLPEGECELDVLDMSAIACGTVSACERGAKHARFVLGPLTDRMTEYCNSKIGKEPYLPSLMEVCVAKCPPYPQWFRAVLVDHKPGEPEAKVCYVDRGNIESVPVSELRKMLPEFVKDVAALALHVEINDFPKDPTPQQLGRALMHMQLDDEGRGRLRVARCEKRALGVYVVHAPALLHAMGR